MKYSFMSFSCPKVSLDEMLKMAIDYDYDGIEPRISANHQHGIEFDTTADQRREIKQKAIDSGIEIGCVATSCRYADPKNSDPMIADTHRAIDLAADIGSTRIRVFGGNLGEKIDRETGIELIADSFRKVADHAEDRGVSICMETHDAWCDPRHVAEIMKRVDHPSIAINWDIMHPVRGNHATIDESFEIMKPWIRHLHVHDGEEGTSDLVPIGEGGYDHRRVIELLLAINFDGFLSGEWINWSDPYENHLPREVKTLRRYESELQ